MTNTSVNDDLSDALKTTIAELDRATDMLSLLIRKSTPVFFRFFELPIISKQEEQKRMAGIHPDTLIVNSLPPGTHLDEYSKTFGNHYAYEDISTVYMPRFPGVIAYPDAPNQIIDAINLVNNLKTRFSAILAAFKAQLFERGMSPSSFDELTHRFIHENCPRLLTEYVKRQIYFYTDPVEKVYFSLRTDIKVNRFSKQQLLDLLRQQLSIANQFDNPELAAQVKSDISIIKSHPADAFTQRCDDYICPTATLRKLNGAPINIRALLPIFLFNVDLNVLSVGNLKSYSKSERRNRQKRADTHQSVHVLPRIGVIA